MNWGNEVSATRHSGSCECGIRALRFPTCGLHACVALQVASKHMLFQKVRISLCLLFMAGDNDFPFMALI